VARRHLRRPHREGEGGGLGYYAAERFLAASSRRSSLQPGQTSGIIDHQRRSGGYHIIEVGGRRSIAQKPLAEMQDELRNRLAKRVGDEGAGALPRAAAQDPRSDEKL